MEKRIFTAKSGRKLNYLLYRTDAGPGEKLPAIIYLHGTDGCGDDINTLLSIETIPSYIERGKLVITRPSMVIAPQCPEGMNWAMLADEVDGLAGYAATLGADENRIALTGASLGGMGTLDIAIKYPERFSCLVPVCARVDAEKCGVLRSAPVWIFHGELDTGMGFSVVEANAVINLAGGNSHLTMLPGEGHEIRWIYCSEKFDVVNWMLDRRRA